MTDMRAEPDRFPTETAGLPECGACQVVELADGDSFDLRIAPVVKRLRGDRVRMLAYNGSIPGPTLKVRQGAEVVVNVTNEADLEATVHWHGLRLDNRYDGTHQTQELIPVGGSFTYRLEFPDPGVYWYHPHTREDYGQEMGLYGNILVVPAEAGYWPRAHREVLLTLDDILLEGGMVAPFDRSHATHTAMGRFGNLLLVSGEPDLWLTARLREVVRFYLTNTANTRVFSVGAPGARMKLVGGDSGRCEHEELVERFVLAPSERAVVDVIFDEPGQVTLEHTTPERSYQLAAITVTEEPAAPSLERQFQTLRSDPDLVAERGRLAQRFTAPPDKTLAFVAEMDLGEPPAGAGGALYTCPMHPDVVSESPGHCSQCGMKLLPTELVDAASGGHDAPPEAGQEAGVHAHPAGHGPEPAGGIEWEDDMVEVNRMTTPANMRWKLVDRATGAENAAIAWRFRVGDRVKIRLVNEMDSDHPMHHPFHIHGAGRFLVLSRDGVLEPNLAWSDTVLVRTGQTVDLLLEVTNPGVWMAHCHIAEHHESGMMFSFDVTP